ncbi:MAG: toprim domain-containing protein [Acetobacteraceae bacterium]
MADAASIAARFGLRRTGSAWSGTCPACGYNGTLSLTDRDGRALWHCHSCQDGAGIARAIGLRSEGYAAPNPPNPPNRPAAPDHRDAARRLWDQAAPIAGTTAERYLAARGLAGFASPALRFLPDQRHAPTGSRWPVMLAACTCPTSGELRAVHRTFLARDGRGKAPVDPAKMTLGPTGGAVIRLAEPEAGKPLVIGEGIESSASAGLLIGAPAWAAIAAGNLSRIVLPGIVKAVVIAADPDPVGQREADAAGRRWQAEGRAVEIATPNDPNEDFNDMMTRHLAGAVAHG